MELYEKNATYTFFIHKFPKKKTEPRWTQTKEIVQIEWDHLDYYWKQLISFICETVQSNGMLKIWTRFAQKALKWTYCDVIGNICMRFSPLSLSFSFSSLSFLPQFVFINGIDWPTSRWIRLSFSGFCWIPQFLSRKSNAMAAWKSGQNEDGQKEWSALEIIARNCHSVKIGSLSVIAICECVCLCVCDIE